MALVTGGASSGKSAFAEQLALSCSGPHAYVATMRHGDDETEARILRHRRMRAGKGFYTIELAGSPAGGEPPCAAVESSVQGEDVCASRQEGLPLQGTVLLEDLGNLVANGLEGRLDEVLACQNVVIVGNEVGCDGVRYDEFTTGYLRHIGALSCALAARADLVVEVVAGIPQVLKAPAGFDVTACVAPGSYEEGGEEIAWTC